MLRSAPYCLGTDNDFWHLGSPSARIQALDFILAFKIPSSIQVHSSVPLKNEKKKKKSEKNCKKVTTFCIKLARKCFLSTIERICLCHNWSPECLFFRWGVISGYSCSVCFLCTRVAAHVRIFIKSAHLYEGITGANNFDTTFF